MTAERPLDAIVVGGGFYGTAIAVYLAGRRGFRDILLVEREPALLTRASYNNQARIHNGYHYPRSFVTAYRSRVNLPRFVKDWPEAVSGDFTKVYAIARNNSKATAGQFRRFCAQIGASLEPADPWLRGLFEPRLIEDVLVVEEYAFDAGKLARMAAEELGRTGVRVRTSTTVSAISRGPDGELRVTLGVSGGAEEQLTCRYVFNCAYSGLNQLGGDFPGTTRKLKQEITELALMRVPAPLQGLGITVMDGPFFSLMPFPARGLHALSHVRYTPHLEWADEPGTDPYRKLNEYDRTSRVSRMVRDARRYMPAVAEAGYVDSLFEVKTVLSKNEGDDGRPILFESHPELPGCYSVLGGKIDNVYDVLEKLEAEPLTLPGNRVG
jgi:glycine/D-amino acid oxidase-like deaminating enzyme